MAHHADAAWCCACGGIAEEAGCWVAVIQCGLNIEALGGLELKADAGRCDAVNRLGHIGRHGRVCAEARVQKKRTVFADDELFIQREGARTDVEFAVEKVLLEPCLKHAGAVVKLEVRDGPEVAAVVPAKALAGWDKAIHMAGEPFKPGQFLEVEIDPELEQAVERRALAQAAGDVAENLSGVADGEVDPSHRIGCARTAPVAQREVARVCSGKSKDGREREAASDIFLRHG